MAIKNINATHRQAMLLHCQGMSIEEIAETINRSPGTLKIGSTGTKILDKNMSDLSRSILKKLRRLEEN